MSTDIKAGAEKWIARTYLRFPMVFDRGSGMTLWDTDGKAYKDFVAGIAVCALGHAHPEVAEALYRQARKLVHVSNLYYTIPQVELAQWLTERSFADRVFFCNSGAEANEAAIKLARRFFYEKGEKKRYGIVSAAQSFHGRTMGALSATGQEKIRKGFDPVLGGFSFVDFGNLSALEKAVGDDTCAVMLEPIQGEGGVCCPDPDYLAGVRSLCDDRGVLLILDEVQTGMGRTGKLFAHEHYGMQPDIMTLAKALGNGLPVGAMLAKETVAEAFGPGAHATTFGGTPLVCAAALAVVQILEKEGIVDHVREMGEYFRSRLLELKAAHNLIEDVRGMGLLVGMKLSVEGAPIVKACMEKGFLINCVQDNILRFVPPLIVEQSDIDELVECLDQLFGER